MIRIGNFLFHWRNVLFPIVYLLFLIKSRPILPDYGHALAVGLVIALVGQLLRAVTIGLDYIKRGGKDRRVYADHLVQGGVFAHSRNPLYLGNFLIITGVALTSNSLIPFSIAVVFFAFAYSAIIAAEEDYLRRKFGATFDEYCQRVNRIIPNFSGFSRSVSGMSFNWRRLIKKEYGSTVVWSGAVVLIALYNMWLRGEYQAGNTVGLWIILGAIALAFVVARFLKKSGLLKRADELAQ